MTENDNEEIFLNACKNGDLQKVQALIETIDDWTEALEEDSSLDAIHMDFKKSLRHSTPPESPPKTTCNWNWWWWS